MTMSDAEKTVGKIEVENIEKYVERIERITEEIQERTEDRKDIYTEAKSNGYDTKALKKIIALRKQDQSEAEADEAIFTVYKRAMGMNI